jgi:hypothetical protein
MCAKKHPGPDGRSCTAPRTSPYARMRHVRFGRCVVAHLGRFLPRLGPFVFPSGPFFIRWPRAISRVPAVAFHSYVAPNFCDAKRLACILCAAHLNRDCEVGDPVADFVALLGRFLPRLGPHGSPLRPLLCRDAARGRGAALVLARVPLLRRGCCNSSNSRFPPPIAAQYGRPYAATARPIRRRRGARARGAAPQTL